MDADETGRMAEWRSSPEFAAARALAADDAREGEERRRERWRREADEIRAYAASLPQHPTDPEASRVFARLVAEQRQPKPARRSGPFPALDRQPLDWGFWADRLRKFRRTGPDKATGCCPAHDDRNPSLTLAKGRAWWVFTCWSQSCSTDAICQALGVEIADLLLED
jgi:hypothetical protein